ncbi:MAG: peptidase M56 BlaR1 [Parcubacteria group bacterium Gr01-1014_13]|nr:MAG: peptidase M56 BlaR1 [Parcubacteria group bacterium Gr01-1014_13]
MRASLRIKSNLLFFQIVSLGTIIFLLFAGLIFKIYNYIFSATGEFALDKANAACGCTTFASPNHTTLIGFLLFVGAALALTLIIAAGRVIFSTIKTNRFVRFKKTKLTQKSFKLAQITDILGITSRVEEIASNDPTIFCYGLIKPKICVSSKVVDSLSSAELRAVLRHETQHMISREPAKLLVIKFINTFRFIPGIKNLTKKYLSFSELAADELATNNFTEKTDLARAMSKILALEEKTIIQKGMALSFFSQITEDRVRVLSENDYIPTFSREIIKVSLGIAVAIAIFFYFSSEIKAQTNYTKQLYANSPCINQELRPERCENGWTNCKNQIFHKKNISCKNNNVWITNTLTK